ALRSTLHVFMVAYDNPFFELLPRPSFLQRRNRDPLCNYGTSIASPGHQASAHPRGLLLREGPVGRNVTLQLVVGPERAHQAGRRMTRGAEQQMTNFVSDGATKERPRVHAVTSGDCIEAIGVHGGERAARLLQIDDGEAKRLRDNGDRGPRGLRSRDDSHEQLSGPDGVGAPY